MTVGLSATQANNYLETHRGTAAPAIATPFVQLHTGDPGAAGTANVAAASTRNAVAWAAAAAGSMALSTLAAFTGTTSETITHISIWTASTAGAFVRSVQLTTPVPIIAASSLTFNSLTLSYTPLAA